MAPNAGWRFSDPYLTSAIQTWQLTAGPSPEQLESFYDWCLLVVGEGPPEESFPVPGDYERFLAVVPAAAVIVDFTTVEQDKLIFVSAIDQFGDGSQTQ